MSEEGLKIKIGADATGVPETFQKVATSVKQTSENFGKAADAGKRSVEVLTNLGRVAQDASYGFNAIANNLNPAFESMQRLGRESGSLGGALKSVASALASPAGIGFAISLAIPLLNKYVFNTQHAAKETSDLAKSLKEIQSNIAGEMAKVSSLITFLEKETATRREKIAAIRELQQIAPNYFSQLDEEKASIGQLKAAYDQYLASVHRAIEAKVIEKQLGDVIDKRLDLEKQINPPQFIRTDDGRMIRNFVITDQGTINKLQNEYNKLRAQELNLTRQLAQLQPVQLNTGKILKEDLKEAAAEQKKLAEEMERLAKKAAERAIKLRGDVQGPVSGGGTDPIKEFLKEQNRFANLTELQGNGPRITPNIPLDTLKNIQKTYGDLAQTLNGALTPAFEAMFTAIDNGQNAFKALGQAIVRSIEQLIAQLAAMVAVAGILSLISGGAVGGGMSFLTAFNSFSPIKLPGHATGGITTGAHVAMVGEAGPEAIIPLDRLPQLIGQITGGNNNGYIAETRISGSDLVVLLSRANKSINRRF